MRDKCLTRSGLDRNSQLVKRFVCVWHSVNVTWAVSTSPLSPPRPDRWVWAYTIPWGMDVDLFYSFKNGERLSRARLRSEPRLGKHETNHQDSWKRRSWEIIRWSTVPIHQLFLLMNACIDTFGCSVVTIEASNMENSSFLLWNSPWPGIRDKSDTSLSHHRGPILAFELRAF